MSRRKNRREEHDPTQRHSTGLTLRAVRPLTTNQSKAFEHFRSNNLVMHGLAGTGKTYVAMYLSLSEALRPSAYRRVVVVRSIVQTRDMGFLPGRENEKTQPYEAPYRETCTDLFGRGDAYSILKRHGVVDFTTTSFIRGKTLRNCVVVVDEIQNMTLHELDSVMTRAGEDCKLVFLGDYTQSDLRNDERAGLHQFLRILRDIPEHFQYVEFGEDDIVRSKQVRDYIVAKNRLLIKT